MVAVNHECLKESELATLQSEETHLGAKVAEHHLTLYGNGAPGLVKQVDRLKQWQDGQVLAEEKRERRGWEIRIALLLLIVKAVVDLYLRHN